MVIILIYVLLGIFIYVVAVPIAEGLVNIVLQQFEIIKGKQLVRITKIQKEVSDLSGEEEELPHTKVIGFALPDDDEEIYEEEEDDDYGD